MKNFYFFQTTIIVLLVLFFCNVGSVVAQDECLYPIPEVKAESFGFTEEDLSIIVLWAVEDDIKQKTEFENYGYILTKGGPNGKAIIATIDPAENTFLNQEKYSGYFWDPWVIPDETYTYEVALFDKEGNVYPPGQAIITAKLDEIEPDNNEQCASDLDARAELEELDEHTKIVKLTWNKYCGESNDFIVYRKQVGQEDEETLINITDSTVIDYYNEETNRIEYMDKTVSQGENEGDLEYEYRIEVWGPKDDTVMNLRNILVSKAFAAEKIKKIEETVKIKMDGTISSPSPTVTNGMLPDNPGLPDMTLTQIIQTIIKVIIAIAQVLLVIMLLIGGFMYITASGNEEQANKARKLIFWAIIGTVVVWSAWAIASSVINVLK